MRLLNRYNTDGVGVEEWIDDDGRTSVDFVEVY